MRACAALIVLAGLIAAPARGAASPTEATDAEALRRIDAGIDAFRKGDLAVARREFEAARQLAPSRANAYRWLGLTEVKLGDCNQALLDFEMFLKLVPANDDRVPEVLRARHVCEQPGPAPSTPPAPVPSPTLVTSTPPPPPSASRPITHRWWFWTSLGAAAVAVGVGVGVGVALAPHESRFAPITCDATGCRSAATP
jgi:hypothetical protein